MNLAFLGPPGAGKGTAAQKLAVQSTVPHVSTGDLFRRAVAARTAIGTQVRAVLARGDLVPDDLTVGLVRERLLQEDARAGFILDGFPRTLAQADALEGIARIDAAVYFDLCDTEIIRRLSGRRMCESCGRIFHVEDLPPHRPGACDACRSTLRQREDDRVEVIERRLAVFRSQTQPLVRYYEESGLLRRVDSSGQPHETCAQCSRACAVAADSARPPAVPEGSVRCRAPRR
jgi:adenylate kinase